MPTNPMLMRSTYETEELDLFRASARPFIEQVCKPNLARWDEQGRVDRDLWLKAGAQGLLCASIPEAYGGGGGHFG
jgi:acyl-CoA dehydrogenase